MNSDAKNNSIDPVGNRYILQEELGSGGMGFVYRSYDRLAQKSVALKRVTVPGEYIDSPTFTAFARTEEVRFNLAQEFQLLASLRHPHIVSVLDFGFYEQNQPYFTI